MGFENLKVVIVGALAFGQLAAAALTTAAAVQC
jgi:hypothetical protein